MEKNGKETAQFPLSTIYFYITDGCNLRCKHCWIQPKFTGSAKSCNYISLELFKSIIGEAKPLGLKSVKLTGGEPLIHPEITGMLRFIKDEGLGLTVETNGTVATGEICRLIAACKNPFVSVSVDGADAAVHEKIRGVEGCFGDAVSGIRALAEAGLKPQVIMTLMAENREQIPPLIDMAKSLNAGSVKINVVQPTARGEKMHQAGQTLPVEELIRVGNWVENELSEEKGIRVMFSHPHAFRPLSRLFGEKGGGGRGVCHIQNIIGVLGNGKYALCGIGETLPELVFGEAGKDKLEEVWNNNPVLTELRDGLPSRLGGVCGRCFMNPICLGSCIAQNYFTNRDLWAPFWFCEEAQKLGLFPETRLRDEKPQ